MMMHGQFPTRSPVWPGVVVEMDTSETVKAGSVTLNTITIQGTSPDFPSVRDIKIATGHFFTMQDLDRKNKVAVLGADLAKQLFGNTDPIGQMVTVGTTKLGVIGVMAAKGTVGNVDFDAQMYIPITVVFQKFTPSMFARIAGDSVRQIVVEVKDGVTLSNVQQQILLLLAKRHDVKLSDDKYAISTQQDIIATQESTTSAFRSLLSWVAGVSLAGGRYRDHEYHDGQRDRTDPGDRLAAIHRRNSQRYPHAIPQ